MVQRQEDDEEDSGWRLDVPSLRLSLKKTSSRLQIPRFVKFA